MANFNSTMVRLKAWKNTNSVGFYPYFNSTMVRLKEGHILMFCQIRIYFNSTMVRLKVDMSSHTLKGQ